MDRRSISRIGKGLAVAIAAAWFPGMAVAQSGRQCAAERNLYSQSSNVRTQLTIVNDAAFPIRLYWISYEGERVLFGTIAPGRSKRQPTFASHPWVITDLYDNCRQLVFAESDNQTYRFNAADMRRPVEPNPYDGPDTVEPLTERDAYRQIDVQVGQEMTIALPSNLSTGYHWETAYERNVSILGDITEERPRNAMIGGGGTSLVSFRVERRGLAEVTLMYLPPGGGRASKTLVYRFRGI